MPRERRAGFAAGAAEGRSSMAMAADPVAMPTLTARAEPASSRAKRGMAVMISRGRRLELVALLGVGLLSDDLLPPRR